MRRWGRILGLGMLSTGMGTLALSRTGVAASPIVYVRGKVNSMAAAEVFARFGSGMGHAITLEQQLRKCTRGGTLAARGSAAMNDLAAYVTLLSKGRVMGSQFGSK